MPREYQETRTETTQFDLPVECGTIRVYILEDFRAVVETLDRIRKYDATHNAYCEGPPLNIKGIDYSVWGHVKRTLQGWIANRQMWNISAHGVNLTKLRENKVIETIERQLTEWERTHQSEMQTAYYEANLIGVNNDIESAEKKLAEAEKAYNDAKALVETLLARECEIKGTRCWRGMLALG
jgi:hypothetical protein